MTDIPKLFNKKTVFGFSIVMTPFFGSLLYAQNLMILGLKKKAILPVLFGLIYMPFANKFIGQFDLNPILTLAIVDVIGGLILIFAFWNEQLGKEDFYNSKNILWPLLVTILLYGTYFGFWYYKTHF